MMLTLYNTLTRKKERFEPIDPSNVRMYVCGPTVYDYAHIGNARPIIVFDVLFRLLRHLYGPHHVTYARNITDIDDKINARAAELYGELPPIEAIRKLTAETTAQFHKDIAALGVLPPTAEPRATDTIPEMRALIEALVAARPCLCGARSTCCSTWRRCRTTAVSPTARWRKWRRARAWMWRPTRRGRWTSCCGSPRKPGVPAWDSPCGIATQGPARLAHRVLGDGRQVLMGVGQGHADRQGPGAAARLRHPRRRHRPGLPAP